MLRPISLRINFYDFFNAKVSTNPFALRLAVIVVTISWYFGDYGTSVKPNNLQSLSVAVFEIAFCVYLNCHCVCFIG